MRFREFALSEFDGDRVPFKTVKERKALIGKRVGFDTTQSSFSQFGRVTAAYGKEIEIDGSPVWIGWIQQLCVLTDQEAA